MTVVIPEPETVRARPVPRQAAQRRRRSPAAPPVRVPYWRRGLRWLAHPRHAYSIGFLVSAGLVDVGIAAFSPPLALIAAGGSAGALCLVGLGITVRGAR